MTLRAITLDDYPADPTPRAADACGPAPQLQWIAIADLVVDPAYQRDITKQGRTNVLRIAHAFDWRWFSPVVVAPIPGGRYAIVDGQHRVTAAARVGHEAVPCQIVQAAPGEQARAFSAINGSTTRVHGLAMHKAAVAAGDRDALAIEAVAQEAGVTILRYPRQELRQQPGETMALNALRESLRALGGDAVALGLKSVVTTPNAVRGGLSATIVKAICQVASEWLRDGRSAERFVAEIARVVLIREADKATRERARGEAAHAPLVRRLRERLKLRASAK